VRWLWEDRIAVGTIALLAGREGIGKSICAYTLAADITRGRLKGVYLNVPRSVIVAATEDSWAHTIVPRLMAASADRDHVFRVDVSTAEHAETGLSLPSDLTALRQEITKTQAALILLDPLLSRLAPALDTHKDADVRRAMEPLAALADQSGACVLALIHVNKSTSADPLTTVMASRAFAAVARAVLFVAVDPDDPGARLLGQEKNNLGRMDLPTLAFRIVGAKVADSAEGPIWTGRLEWRGESDRTIRDAIQATTDPGAGNRTATSEAADWLSDYLASEGGTAESSKAKAAGRQAGHSESKLKAAMRKIRVTVDSRGFPRRTYWTAQSVGSVHGESDLTELTEPTEGQSGQSAQWDQSAQTPHASEPTDGGRS
jgi:hypothetical protein